jgi:hypothetical protein
MPDVVLSVCCSGHGATIHVSLNRSNSRELLHLLMEDFVNLGLTVVTFIDTDIHGMKSSGCWI